MQIELDDGLRRSICPASRLKNDRRLLDWKSAPLSPGCTVTGLQVSILLYSLRSRLSQQFFRWLGRQWNTMRELAQSSTWELLEIQSPFIVEAH